MVLLTDRRDETNLNSRLDDHDGIGIVLDDQLDDSFYSRKKFFLLSQFVGAAMTIKSAFL